MVRTFLIDSEYTSAVFVRELHDCFTDEWCGKDDDGQHDKPRYQPR